MRVKSRRRYLILAVLLLISLCLERCEAGKKQNKEEADNNEKKGVTYDGTSLIINGKRKLIYSGSVHYPRSTPEMWPEIIERAKQGKLNTIQTYVFWNVHEPEQGKYDFSGRFDLVRFIKLIHKKGLFVTLRVGPFIQAEWNHGGLPYWLREVPGIYFRTDNTPFKEHTERYVRKILDMMKEEKLFISQGGPIILGQIENEYNAVQLAYKEDGENYIKWAANLVASMKLGIPWVMCKQNDVPGDIINACNGRHCGDTFPGPNTPNKPSIWTENWTTQFRVFGDPPTHRTPEDIAFSVARFFSKNGSHVNYYMYHGGTNFGRTAAHFVTTRYYDDAPLDEYGMENEPKYGHLKHLHRALALCKKALFWGQPTSHKLGPDTEVRYYQKAGTNLCAAFLANNNTREYNSVNFKNRNYVLPPRSISILPDCKTVVFNTKQIVAQHNWREFVKSEKSSKGLNFEMFSEEIPMNLDGESLLPSELYFLTKDKTDYGWYTSKFKIDEDELPKKKDTKPKLQVASLGHALIAYVNGEYAGTAHGSHEGKSFVFNEEVNLKAGENQVAILGVLTGLPDSGSYMEKRYAGPRGVSITGLTSGRMDLTEESHWGHLAGLEGEKKEVYTEEGSEKVKWKINGEKKPLTWYKTYFETPEGKNTVAIRMNGMGKGLIWVNGNGVGRYWMSFLSPLDKPSQTEYHIPRSFMKKKEKNLLVILEEEPNVKPEEIDFVLANRDTICSYVKEGNSVSVKYWKRQGGNIVPKVKDMKLKSVLKCPPQKKIVKVEFASFGDPLGTCGNFTVGNCTADTSKQVIEKTCLGKSSCSIVVGKETFGDTQCKEIMVKTLAVQVKCEKKDLGKDIEADVNKEEDDVDSDDDDDEDDDDGDDEDGGGEEEEKDEKKKQKKKKNKKKKKKKEDDN